MRRESVRRTVTGITASIFAAAIGASDLVAESSAEEHDMAPIEWRIAPDRGHPAADVAPAAVPAVLAGSAAEDAFRARAGVDRAWFGHRRSRQVAARVF